MSGSRIELTRYLGKRVRVSKPHSPLVSSWEGELIALLDEPSLILRLDSGKEMTVPQRFSVEQFPPDEPRNAVVRDRDGMLWEPARDSFTEWVSQGRDRLRDLRSTSWQTLWRDQGPLTIYEERR